VVKNDLEKERNAKWEGARQEIFGRRKDRDDEKKKVDKCY
jgi:hypothetical protein